MRKLKPSPSKKYEEIFFYFVIIRDKLQWAVEVAASDDGRSGEGSEGGPCWRLGEDSVSDRIGLSNLDSAKQCWIKRTAKKIVH